MVVIEQLTHYHKLVGVKPDATGSGNQLQQKIIVNFANGSNILIEQSPHDHKLKGSNLPAAWTISK